MNEGWKLFVVFPDGTKGTAAGIFPDCDYNLLWQAAYRKEAAGEIKEFSIKWVKVFNNQIVEIMDKPA